MAAGVLQRSGCRYLSGCQPRWIRPTCVAAAPASPADTPLLFAPAPLASAHSFLTHCAPTISVVSTSSLHAQMSLSLAPANSCGGGQLLGPHADPSLYLWLTGTSGATVLSASPEWQEGAPPPVEGAEVAPLPAAPAPAQGGQTLTALQLRFQLPPSSYATMAIRQASPNSPLSLQTCADCTWAFIGMHPWQVS